MASRPPSANRPLPQVRGTPANRAALATQLNAITNANAKSTTEPRSEPAHPLASPQPRPRVPSAAALDLAAQRSQHFLHTINTNTAAPATPAHPSTSNIAPTPPFFTFPSYSATRNTPADLDAQIAQMEYLMSNLARLSPDPENTAQMAVMAQNLANMQGGLEGMILTAAQQLQQQQTRLSAQALEFTPSPTPRLAYPVEKGKGKHRAGKHSRGDSLGKTLRQSPEKHSRRDSQSKSQKNSPRKHGRGESWSGSLKDFTAVADAGVPFLNNNNNINNTQYGTTANPLNQSAAAAAVPTFTFTAEAPQQQYTTAQAHAQLAAIYGSSMPLAVQKGGQGTQGGPMIPNPMSMNPVTGRNRTSVAHLRAISDSASQRRLSAQLGLSGPQAQAQAQELKKQQQTQWWDQSQEQGFGQDLQSAQRAQNAQFTAQQTQLQYPYGVNDMSYPPANHAHPHPQHLNADFTDFNSFNNFTNAAQDFSQMGFNQLPAAQGYLPQTYDAGNSGMEQYPSQQQQYDMAFANGMQRLPEGASGDPNSRPLMPPPGFPSAPRGNNFGTIAPFLQSSMATGFRDSAPRAQSGQGRAGSAQEVAGYFPSAYELSGKWNTLPPHMRTPPGMLWQQSGSGGMGGDKGDDKSSDEDDQGPGPGNGTVSPANQQRVDGDGNGGDISLHPSRDVTDARADGNGEDSSRQNQSSLQVQPATPNQPGNTRPSACHTWRSATHTINSDFATLTRNAGHLDLLNSPAFPQNASEYAGLRADTLADKQRRLQSELASLTAPKSATTAKIDKPLGGKTFDSAHSAVLAAKTHHWIPASWDPTTWPKAQFPNVAEMKKEQALHMTMAGRPSRFFPRPKAGDTLDGRASHDAMDMLQWIAGATAEGWMLTMAQVAALNESKPGEEEEALWRAGLADVSFEGGEWGGEWRGAHWLGEMSEDAAERRARERHEMEERREAAMVVGQVPKRVAEKLIGRDFLRAL